MKGYVIPWFKPGSHLCDKHNTRDISTSISTRKKKQVPFFLCLCLCLCRLCYAYRTSVNQALGFILSVHTAREKRSFISTVRPTIHTRELKRNHDGDAEDNVD